MENKNYYLGLDIGTDSVGYAVTDEAYNLLKFHGEPAWGTTIFDEAELKDKRRGFRSARRRLDRRQQRVNLVEELFAEEIGKIDERFFIRIQGSYLSKSETDDKFTLFCDDNYTDADYYKDYPTIHHLICDLMKNTAPHDVRLVYIACAWLVAHRGHFLSNLNKENLSDIKNFDFVYESFNSFFIDNGYAVPWICNDVQSFGNALKNKNGITAKTKQIVSILYGSKKPSKEATEDFPFSADAIIKLLAGGSVKPSIIFCNEEYDELASISLGMDEGKFGEIMPALGDNYGLIETLRNMYDWGILVESLGGFSTISEAKVDIYQKHQEDLKFLKYFIRKYCNDNYNDMFRKLGKDNYSAYAYHSDEKGELKKKGIEEFSKYVLSVVKDVNVSEEDRNLYEDMILRLNLRTFMPKQKTTDNRVIPHQLYWFEMKEILKNAENYLPFLKVKDEFGLTVTDKLLSIFLYRIPYFVGPLNPASEYAWIKRKADKIYPWNFESIVDLDATEDEFIRRLTNKCTYLPDQNVLPKDSLLYHKYMVLNEINNIRINGERISVELKQRLYNEEFMCKKSVTLARIKNFFNVNFGKDENRIISGVDVNIKSNLAPQIAFRNMLQSGIISEDDAEKIIERSTYAEDKSRLSNWLERNYPHISDDDRKYLCSLKFKNFGRLSRKLLSEIQAVDANGEIFTVESALWNTQYNLMEIIESDNFTFKEVIKSYREQYYDANKLTLQDRMNEMYLSNSVQRSVYRTLDIVKDVAKAFGKPAKIFVETTRSADDSQKGKRTKSRKEQILELYAKCKHEDIRELKAQLDAMGDYADNRLQGDKLFLYYMQLGKSMYSGKQIELEKLSSKEYDIEHIYPQAYVKDDSIINNKVLVLSTENGAKQDTYPISSEIRENMTPFWQFLKHNSLISEEKYKRLTRATPFSNEEKMGFINRQLTETSQSTKAVATLLKEYFPQTEIVYCKARLTSEFRQEFDLIKSRLFNDLHHAVDAYLNIAAGNVYNCKFTHNFNVNNKYSIKTKALFTHELVQNGKLIWNEEMLVKVKKTAEKNTAHFTKYSLFKKGGFFDQTVYSPSPDLVPLKKNRPAEIYGGYNKSAIMFFIPVRYYVKKKTEIFIMSVELLYGKKFLSDKNFALEYSIKRLEKILGKSVEKVEFPLGTRPWKINTMLSLDGFRVCIAGVASGGRCIIAQPVMQFSANSNWKIYLKRLESFVGKFKKYPNFKYDLEFDKISKEENIKLYELYIDKLQNSIYSKRINNPLETLVKGKEKFESLDIYKQSEALLNIHQVFGRIAGGCDLQAIGGSKNSAATSSFSTTVSNWKKNYKNVHIVDSSVSGLWQKESENILDLL